MAAEVAGSADGSDAVFVCSVGSLTIFDAALFLVATSPTDAHRCMLALILRLSGGDELPLHRCRAVSQACCLQNV